MKDVFKGLLLIAILAIISILLNLTVFPFIETLTIGIVLGILAANLLKIPENFDPGINFAFKNILKWGIVLLGVKLNFSLIIELGPIIATLIILMITLSLFVALFIGKYYNLSPKLATLLGVGSSICGASAIVAMGPVIKAKEEEIAISVTVISLLGAIGVILYSFVGNYLPLTDLEYGIWSGISLQGVAHALAAAGARGTENISLEIGTLVKMARVACLAPLALILQKRFNKSNKESVPFPKYVLYFILVGCFFTLNHYFSLFPTTFTIGEDQFNVVSGIKKVSSTFILMAMIGMGLKVNIKSLETRALNALKVCTFVFIILSISSLFLVHFI